jgi:hypothetical protein
MQIARSIVGVVLASVVLFGITSGRDLVWLALPRSAQYRLCLRDAAPILGPRVADLLEKSHEEFRLQRAKEEALARLPTKQRIEQLQGPLDKALKLLSQSEPGIDPIRPLEETCTAVTALNLQTILERHRADLKELMKQLEELEQNAPSPNANRRTQ